MENLCARLAGLEALQQVQVEQVGKVMLELQTAHNQAQETTTLMHALATQVFHIQIMQSTMHKELKSMHTRQSECMNMIAAHITALFRSQHDDINADGLSEPVKSILAPDSVSTKVCYHQATCSGNFCFHLSV
jgi:hypothetical protein